MFKWLSQRKSKEKNHSETGQTVAEVIDPIEIDNVSSQVPSDSLRALLKTAIADAEKIAASIKAGAEKEAGAETSRIIAQTELEAQKIKGEAEIAARQQAEEIISEARKQAEVTGVELKHRTLQFLISASEEVKEEISKDYNEAYSRLSSSLQDIMTEAENIERPLKDKITTLWESKNLELKEFKTALLGTPETTRSIPETPAASEPNNNIIEIAEESVTLEEETSGETPAEPVEPKEEISGETPAELVELKEETSEETPAEPAELKEETSPETTEEPVKSTKKSSGRKKQGNEKTARKDPSVIIGDDKPYNGTIELNIASPAELRLVSKLYNFLQTVPELRILYTKGSWDKGTKITVVLEKTMPLIGILSKSPDFKVTAEELEADSKTGGKSNGLLRGEEKAMQRIELSLEEK